MRHERAPRLPTEGLKVSGEKTVAAIFSRSLPPQKGSALHFADSQVSRTHLQTATSADSGAPTWGSSCQTENFSTPETPFQASSSRVLHGYSHTLLTQVSVPSAALVRRIYRQAVLEKIIRPRLRTERGQDSLTLRWYGIPEDASPEETAEKLTAELAADDAAAAAVAEWATSHLPERPGRSLSLPAPESGPGRWQGPHLWVTGALSDPAVTEHPRMKRVGRQHRRFLLRAMASYADHDSGYNVTAANRSIGRRAAELCTEHIDRGGTWRGRRTDQLSETTLAGLVSAMTTALADAGWLRERARGRHLNRLERAAAWLRLHIHQTRAASTRDLTVPDAERRPVPRPTAPAWVSPDNPHVQKLTFRELWEIFRSLLKTPVLHTHRACGTLSGLLTVLGGELTRASAREKPQSTKKQATPPPPPSIEAQKLGATLRRSMPWLLRGATPGKRRHANTLARILDDLNLADLTARVITHHIDQELTTRQWEIHPSSITQPLAWIHTVLRGLIGKCCKNTQFLGLSAKKQSRSYNTV